jgi:hypothetical protein
MHPKNVTSPRDRIVGGPHNIRMLQDGDAATADLNWIPRDGGDAIKVRACRWNGELDDEDDKGNPRSHGQGTWFVLPESVAWHDQLLEYVGEQIRKRYNIKLDDAYDEVCNENERTLRELIIQSCGPFLKAMWDEKHRLRIEAETLDV